MENAEATPRPWSIAREVRTGPGDVDWLWIMHGNCARVARVVLYDDSGEHEANAELIVRAVNAHDALVAALERARDAVEAIVLSTHSISFDADLRAIDSALLLAKRGAPASSNEEAA